MESNKKECCTKQENLSPIIQERADLVYRVCSVCSCRHFELTVDPGKLGLKGIQV